MHEACPCHPQQRQKPERMAATKCLCVAIVNLPACLFHLQPFFLPRAVLDATKVSSEYQLRQLLPPFWVMPPPGCRRVAVCLDRRDIAQLARVDVKRVVLSFCLWERTTAGASKGGKLAPPPVDEEQGVCARESETEKMNYLRPRL